MLADAAAAGIVPLPNEVLSVEEVGVFKPDRLVFRRATRQFGRAAHGAARRLGMRGVRADRAGAPVRRA